jgi:hypothetical protein
LDTDLEIDLEKNVGSDLWMDCSFRRGVEGDELAETLDTLTVLCLGDGVRGIRPPAVLEEKRPWWLLRGVDNVDAVAIVSECVRIMIEWANKCFDRCQLFNRESIKNSEGLVVGVD